MTLGIREKINQNSAVSVGIGVCILLGGAIAIGLELKGNNGLPPALCYYTVDDGKTWFSDGSTKLPPFDHDGQPAVRCLVFKGPSGKFAGLLEKYSDDVRAKLAAKGDQWPPEGTPILVKKPGDSKWQQMGVDQEASILLKMTGPDGSTDVERIMP
jgi:hypothetical protein